MVTLGYMIFGEWDGKMEPIGPHGAARLYTSEKKAWSAYKSWSYRRVGRVEVRPVFGAEERP